MSPSNGQTNVKNLEDTKQVITTNPLLIYPDPNKHYYLFTDSSKILLEWNLMQYSEQTKDNGTKIKMPYPINYQSRAFQGSQELEHSH